jgi:hypothetical protein
MGVGAARGSRRAAGGPDVASEGKGEVVSSARVREALGEEGGAFLEPYLSYTRATPDDLQRVVEGAAVPSLREAERQCGAERLRKIVAEIGWPRLAYGLDWTERFHLWGALPVSRMLSGDRRGILESLESGPLGERARVWCGEAPYRDRFGPAPAESRLRPLFERLERLGLEPEPPVESERHWPIGQLALERRVLRPLRAALARGAVLPHADGPRATADDRCRPEHEAERFAVLLATGGEDFRAAARLARLTPLLERSLRFVTTGTVNGHEVQRCRLLLRGATLGLFVLRGERGVARLALIAPEETLWLQRNDADDTWRSSARSDDAELIALLRRGRRSGPSAGCPWPRSPSRSCGRARFGMVEAAGEPVGPPLPPGDAASAR